MDSFASQFRQQTLNAVPAAFLLLIVLLGAVLRPGSYFPPVYLAWAVIFYWSLFQPQRLNYLFLALAGLLQDVAFGLPLGISPLGFLLLRLAALQVRRRVGLNHFMALWACFAVLSFGLALLTTLLLAVLTPPLSLTLLLQALFIGGIIAMLYPLLHLLCHRLDHLLTR